MSKPLSWKHHVISFPFGALHLNWFLYTVIVSPFSVSVPLLLPYVTHCFNDLACPPKGTIIISSSFHFNTDFAISSHSHQHQHDQVPKQIAHPLQFFEFSALLCIFQSIDHRLLTKQVLSKGAPLLSSSIVLPPNLLWGC